MAGVVRTVAQTAVFATATILGGPTAGAVANTIFNLVFPIRQEGQTSRLSDLMREGAEIGSVIKKFYGIMPTSADVIDCGVDADGVPAGIEEVVTDKKIAGGTGKGLMGGQTAENYAYFATMALLLGGGPLYVIKMTEENASGEKVVYERWNVGMPNPKTFAFRDLWKQIIKGDSPYLVGRGVELIPEYEGGELICETSANIRLYPGTERQRVDPKLAMIHGDDALPYRGNSMVMLDHYGPLDGSTTWKFIVWSPLDGIREIAFDRFGQAAVPDSRIALENLEARIHGAAVTQIEPASDIIDKAAGTQLCDVSFINGAFRTLSRINPAYWRLKQGEASAYVMSGDDKDYPSELNVDQKSEKQLPSSLTIRFIDPDNDYEENEAIAYRHSALHENAVSVELPFAMYFADAMKLAQILLDEMWANTSTDKITLLPEHDRIAQGNVIIYETKGGILRQIRIHNQNLGTKTTLEQVGSPYDPSVYGVHMIIQPTARPEQAVTTYTVPIIYVGDLPALNRDSQSTAGITFAATVPNDATWAGAYFLSEGAQNFDTSFVASRKATIAELVSSMNFSTSKLYKWNDDDFITVHLLGGDVFSSYSDLFSLANNANVIAVGDCIVQYKTATQISPGIFKLQGLWYGRFGTDSMAGQNFPAGTKILRLFDENGTFEEAVNLIPISDSMIGTERSFEVFSYRDENKTTGDLALTFHARAYIPPKPQISVDREESGDVTFSIFLGTRDWESAAAQPFTGRPVRKTDPDVAHFKLTNGATTVFENNISGVMNPVTIHYTAAQITSMYGGSPPSSYVGTVAHEGTLSRGYETTFSL